MNHINGEIIGKRSKMTALRGFLKPSGDVLAGLMSTKASNETLDYRVPSFWGK